MNQPIKDLIAAANATNCHCATLLHIIANKPSLDPSFMPITDLLQAANHFMKVGHRIEMRGVISAQLYELANTDFAAANALVNALSENDDLRLQLDAVLLVVIMWRSTKQAA